MRPEILEFYAAQGPLTDPGRYRKQLEALPNDLGELVRIVQGLVLHEYGAAMYGVTIPEQRRDESHLRRVEAMLDRLFAIDDRPLTQARPVEKRLVGVCNHYMQLLLAMLRTKGMSSRGRCGFGSYFNPGFWEDHWLCEYWNPESARWQYVDAQFDEVWIKNLKIDHDVLDVPHDRFLTAGNAWRLCRNGEADASKFGIFRGDLRGLWFIATDLVHDIAALNKMELLPWDAWGAAPKGPEQLDEEQLAFFDELAALSQDPVASFAAVRTRYEREERIRVPDSVFNALRQRAEKV